MPLEALILDYGNVLTHPQPTDWCESVASLVGVSTEAFREAYWEHRQRYDAGLPAAEYWRRVLETLGHSPRASEVGVIIDRLVEADVASWTRYREEVWDLALSFRLDGGRTAFLSNGVVGAMVRRGGRLLRGWCRQAQPGDLRDVPVAARCETTPGALCRRSNRAHRGS